MARESARKRKIQGNVQEKVLGAEHKCRHRLDLSGSRSLPEILDRDVNGWGPVFWQDLRAYVEQTDTLESPVLETGIPVCPSPHSRCRPRRDRISHAFEERFDPGCIALSDQQIDLPRRSQCRRRIDEGCQRRALEDDRRKACLGEPLECLPEHLALVNPVNRLATIHVAKALGDRIRHLASCIRLPQARVHERSQAATLHPSEDRVPVGTTFHQILNALGIEIPSHAG
jgi:hypothetical protein